MRVPGGRHNPEPRFLEIRCLIKVVSFVRGDKYNITPCCNQGGVFHICVLCLLLGFVPSNGESKHTSRTYYTSIALVFPSFATTRLKSARCAMMRRGLSRSCKDGEAVDVAEQPMIDGAGKRKRPRDRNGQATAGAKRGPKTKTDHQAQLRENVRAAISFPLGLSLIASSLCYLAGSAPVRSKVAQVYHTMEGGLRRDVVYGKNRCTLCRECSGHASRCLLSVAPIASRAAVLHLQCIAVQALRVLVCD